jgi:hypothetical protein
LRALPARGEHLGFAIEDGELARQPSLVPLRRERIGLFGGCQ